MLADITIRNFAIISDLHLSFGSGMTVFTGETGAGKSIVMDALAFALGQRMETSSIRHGCEQAEVSLIFELSNRHNIVLDWLKTHNLSADGHCIIRRLIQRSGRSKCHINDQPVTLQLLKQLGPMLVDFHGQHQHYSLLKQDTQRQMLDAYANNRTLLDTVQSLATQYHSVEKEIASLKNQRETLSARRSLLCYQVEELRHLAPMEGEYTRICERHQMLANAETLHMEMNAARQCLSADDGQSAFTLTQSALSKLKSITRYHAQLESLLEPITSAAVLLQESAAEICHLQDSIEYCSREFSELDDRIGHYQNIARKHHADAAQLPELLAQLEQELGTFDDNETRLQTLESTRLNIAQQYAVSAQALSQSRVDAAERLGEAITRQFDALHMKHCQLHIALTPSGQAVSPTGLETIEFLICTNPGQEAQPMAKIASGGELSRISLAIQVILARCHTRSSLVFDEVDVGIGGATAQVVGMLLRELGALTQILCITHQGQVAAQGHQHIKISKKRQKRQTHTSAVPVNNDERVSEIARMIGGIELTQHTINHAEELLSIH